MFSNYLKIAIRNLAKNKTYSIINVTGLAVGLGCCILIFLYVQNELSYDRHHLNGERIYRVVSEFSFGGEEGKMAVTPAPLAKTIAADYPEVEAAVRFRRYGPFLVKSEGAEQNYNEERVVFADNDIFNIFTIPLLAGDPGKAIAEPNTVVISSRAAQKHFGEQQPIGKTLVFDNNAPFLVTGIFADMPGNSHFHFDFIASLESRSEGKITVWGGSNFQTYLLLAEGSNPDVLQAKFPAMLVKYKEPLLKQVLGIGYEELAEGGSYERLSLQPLFNIHLHSDLTAEFEPNGSSQNVYIFSAIAFFILLIACVNFMNLSTARSANRAREVGVRKVLGSMKKQLVWQFLLESLCLCLLGLVLALGLVEFMLPAFNHLAGRNIETGYLQNWPLLGLLAGMVFFTGIGAGSYPAFLLSSFKPVKVLKGRFQNNAKLGWLRSGLVIFQFTTSLILLLGTLIVKDQLNFIQKKSIGFNKEQVIVVHDAYALGNRLDAFKKEVLRHSGMVSGTVSSHLPVPSFRSSVEFWPEGGKPDKSAVTMQIWHVDYDYVKTLGMEIREGRDFSSEFATDSSGILINEKAAAMFAFENPIGKRILAYDFIPGKGVDFDNPVPHTIIGVVQNFHFESFREDIGALGLRVRRSRAFALFRFKVENAASSIDLLETEWQKFGPGQPFAYSFLDDRFAQMYSADQRLGKIIGVFSALAIFTACLGLFGLASFMAQQRTQEIGIRKVLGASVGGIVAMITNQFARYVLVAGLIASPLAWLMMREWLANFAYRTEISPMLFIIAISSGLVLAILTVSYQALKAALGNPINALKYE